MSAVKPTDPAPTGFDAKKPLSAPDKFLQFSRDDVLNALEYYFGPPARPQLLDSYTNHHAATLNFPAAYAGTSVKIREAITNLIVENVQSFLTTEILPWKKQDNPNFSWDEHIYDIRMLQPVPYEGVSRNQTSLSRSHSGKMIRRGIGLILESDFFATAAGKKMFAEHLTGIQLSVQETENYDVMFALLTTENSSFKYMRDRGLIPRRFLLQALREEVASFAVAQKDGRGFERIIEAAKMKMGLYHVKPDSIIIAPQMALYLTMGPAEKIHYSIVGPSGPASFNAGPQALESGNVRGLNVYEVLPFDVGEQHREALQMLSRNVQTGEYYTLIAPPQWEKSKPLPREAYDIVIYDEASDDHKLISLERAMMASLIPEVHAQLKMQYKDVADKNLDILHFRQFYDPDENLAKQNPYRDNTMETLMAPLDNPKERGFDPAKAPRNVASLLLTESGRELFLHSQRSAEVVNASALPTTVKSYANKDSYPEFYAMDATRDIVYDKNGKVYVPISGGAYRCPVPWAFNELDGIDDDFAALVAKEMQLP